MENLNLIQVCTAAALMSPASKSFKYLPGQMFGSLKEEKWKEGSSRFSRLQQEYLTLAPSDELFSLIRNPIKRLWWATWSSRYWGLMKSEITRFQLGGWAILPEMPPRFQFNLRCSYVVKLWWHQCCDATRDRKTGRYYMRPQKSPTFLTHGSIVV